MNRFQTYGVALGLLLAQCSFSLAVANAQGSVSPDPRSIRVSIVQSDPQVNLQIHGQYLLREMGSGSPLKHAGGMPQVIVRGVSEGIQFGQSVLPVFGVHIEPSRDADINLNGTRLRGTVEIMRQQDFNLQVINHVPLESYLRGVLSKEAPDYWPQEALKAIAIAARTYAVYRRYIKVGADFDVTSNVLSQDYGGKSSEKKGTDIAVEATAGKIVLFEGKLFPPFYHSTCGGIIENASIMGEKYDIPPLEGGFMCKYCTASPFHTWKRRLTKEDVNWVLHKGPHGKVGTVREVVVTKRTAGGRAEQVKIVGDKRTLELTGYDFRALFGFEMLRSLQFNVTKVDDAFVVEGHGWGHGVGLCQWGAAELARLGYTAEQILEFYYPGIQHVDLETLLRTPVEVIGS